MYRVRAPNGSEVEYATGEEFVEAVRKGAVSEDAEIFHQRTGRWLPIRMHPDFRAAMGLALEAEPRRPVASRRFRDRSDRDEPTPVVAMAAPGVRRRRTNPLVPLGIGLAIVAGLIIFVALVYRSPEPISRLDTTGSPIKSPARETLPASARGTAAPRRDTAQLGGPKTAQASAPAVPPAPITQDTTPKPPPPPPAPAPQALVNAQTAAFDSAYRRFEQRWKQLGLTNLLSPGRIHSADSVRITRRGIAAARTRLTEYQVRLSQATQRYGDSARTLIRESRWSDGQENTWQGLSSKLQDVGVRAMRADTLLEAVEQLYGVLLEQEGQYDNDEKMISFNDPDAAARYGSLRERIIALAGRRPDPVRAPLREVQAAIGADTLPEVVERETPIPPPGVPLPSPR